VHSKATLLSAEAAPSTLVDGGRKTSTGHLLFNAKKTAGYPDSGTWKS